MVAIKAVLLGALPLLSFAAPADHLKRDDASTTSSSTTSATPTSNSTTTGPAPSSTSDLPLLEDKPFNLPPMPDVCKDPTVPLETTVRFKSNQVDVYPYGVSGSGGGSPRWAGDQPFNWTFSTSTPGIYFTTPAVPGSSCDSTTRPDCHKLNIVPRTDPGSFTLQMTNGDSNINQIMWSIFKAKDGQKVDSQCWNYTDNRNLPKDCPQYTDEEFIFTVKGSSPCAHPTGNMTCADNTIPRTTDAWASFNVDGFFKDWVSANKGKFGQGSKSMLSLFASQYGTSGGTGKLPSISSYSDTLGECSDLPNKSNNTLAAQVYLTWIALENLSDTMNLLWTWLNLGESDATLALPNMVETFWAKDPPPAAPGVPPLSEASTILGLIGSVMGRITGPVATAGGWVSFASTIVGAANTFEVAKKAPAPLPDPIANLSAISTFLGNFVTGTRGNLEDTYDQIFSMGNNITSILAGGAFVNRTDLALDDPKAQTAGEGYLDQYLGLKTLNMAWWTNNVFITYIPYGKVVQVGASDSAGTLSTTDFDEGACVSNFQQADWTKNGWGKNMKDEKTLTICHTDDWKLGNLPPGMARLTWYNPSDQDSTRSSQEDGHLFIYDTAPGALNNTKFNVTGGGGWVFNVEDVVKSSVQSFATGGYQYNPAYGALHASGGINSFDLPKIAQTLFNSTPGDAGTFNLPVCVLNNLNSWPNLYQVDGSGAWSSPHYVDTYCVCSRTVDMHGTNMSSVAPPALQGKLQDPDYLDNGCMQSTLYGAWQLPLPKM